MLDKSVVDKALAEYVGKKLGRYLTLKQENLKREYFEEIKKIVDEIGYDKLTKKSQQNYDKIYGKPGEETEVKENEPSNEEINEVIDEVLENKEINRMDIDIEEDEELDELV